MNLHYFILGNCVHTKTCTGFAERSNICNGCYSFCFDKNLSNKIRKKIPSPSNIKFTSKYYWKDNVLRKYLQNVDLRTVWNLLNNDSENNTANS
jgi:hypothetical protein